MFNITRTKTALYLLLLLILIGCTPSLNVAPTPGPAATQTPWSTYSFGTNLAAKGIIVPKYSAQLAYGVSGRVQNADIKIGDEVHAGDPLVQLDTVILEADVAHAEGALQAAQAELEYDKLQRNTQQLQVIAAANISIAEADLARARAILAQATLTSPLDGTIVDVQVIPGQIVSPGKVIVTLADLRSLQVETLDLSEDDIPKVYVGQPVEITIHALDTKVEGVVVAIAPQATVLGDKNVYKVTIKFKSQPTGLRWGMSVEANFIVNG